MATTSSLYLALVLSVLSTLSLTGFGIRRMGVEHIMDITHDLKPGLPIFGSPTGMSPFLKRVTDIRKGGMSNTADFHLFTHAGTHVDAPGHFNETLMEEGYDVASLDLRTLRGPGLVIDAPRGSNITAAVLQSLRIPRGTQRVLFRTLNTDRRLMHRSQFDSSYTGFTLDGAKYLVEKTDIRLVGIDYLSIAVSTQLRDVHLVMLNTKVVIPVEGLNLDGVAPGPYFVDCLPMKLDKGDGGPARCVLIKSK